MVQSTDLMETDSEKTLAVQFVAYLKDRPASDKLMNALRERYRSLGKVGGVLKLGSLNQEETLFLQGLFRRAVHGQSSDFKASELIKALKGTAFEGVNLELVLQLYFKAPLQSNSEKLLAAASQRQQVFERVLSSSSSSGLKEWVYDAMATKTSGSWRLLLDLYRQGETPFASTLKSLDAGIVILEGLELHHKEHHNDHWLLLPLFAGQATANPHAFDEGTDLHKLLVAYLAWQKSIKLPESAEEKAVLLFDAGILQDSGARTVMTYGLKAFDAEGNPLGWEVFSNRQEPLTLNLMNLESAHTITTKSELKIVFAFENPSIFQTMMRTVPEAVTVCTGGQLNGAAYILLDNLTVGGCKILYAGDFDPEGLIIAEKLKRRYGQALELLAYDELAYGASCSEVPISDKRLKQLDALTTPELINMADQLRFTQRAAYQERLVERLRGEVDERIRVIQL